MVWIEGGLVSLSLLLLALVGAKPSAKGTFYADYLSLSKTKPLRGLFAVVIIIHHLSGWYSELSPMTVFSHIGYLIVALFFFLSGYGLYYSFSQKPNYLNGFLQNRLSNVLLPYYICTVIWAVGLSASGVKKGIVDTLLSMLGIRIFVAGGWYACALTILYILFFVSFRRKKTYAFKVFVVLMVVTTVLLYLSKVDSTWTRSLCGFPVGILWCKYKSKIDAIIRNRYWFSLILTAIVFAVACGIRFFGVFTEQSIFTEVGNHLSSALAPVFLFTLLQKITIHNRPLDFLGEISNEIYLLHYLFLILLGKLSFVVDHVFLFVLLTLICVIPIAWAVHKADTFLLRKLKALTNR